MADITELAERIHGLHFACVLCFDSLRDGRSLGAAG